MAEPASRRLRPATIPARGAAAVAARVLSDIDALVETMGEAYQREIPEYAAMSPAQMQAEVLPVSARVVHAFFDAFLAGTDVPPRVLRAFEVSGRSRLKMGVPLDSVLHAYRVAGRVTWDAIVAATEHGEEALLGELAARWIDFIDHASSMVAAGYLSESHQQLRYVDARRRELVEALLTAADPAEVAAVSLRFSTVLAARYVPVLVGGGGAAGHIDALLGAAPAGTLGGHRGDRVLLLVPDSLEEVRRLNDAVEGGLIAWGCAAAPGPALLDEVRHVEELLQAAVAEGHPTGAYGPDDLLVEQLLLGNARVAQALRRRVCDVLLARDPSGALVSTLRRYLARGSIPQTAREEVVHANTVNYRLGRVRDLTGLDPRVPADATLLVLGLGLPAGQPEA